jgi:DNA-binding LytR/AlgR family response regulator
MKSERIKILIVEDKPIIAESIASILLSKGMDPISSDTGEQAVTLAKSNQPDMIIMDIQLAGNIDGIEAANQIRQHCPAPLIYLTEYTDQKTIDRAKQTFPANYLAKPFSEAELLRAIDIAITNAQNFPAQISSKDLLIRTDSQDYVKIKPDDILYLEANRAYSHIITTDRKYTLSSSMNQVAKQLQNPDFVRVHRKYIVNVNRITALNGNVLKVGSHDIQISKEHRDDLLDRMKIIK